MTVAVSDLRLLVIGLLFAVFAVLVLRVGWTRTANRALALAFLSLSLQWLPRGVVALLRHPEWEPWMVRVGEHLYFLDGLMLLAVAANYPTLRPGLPKWAGHLWPYLAAAALFEVAFIIDREAFLGPGWGWLAIVDDIADVAAFSLLPILLLRRDKAGHPPAVGQVLLALGLARYLGRVAGLGYRFASGQLASQWATWAMSEQLQQVLLLSVTTLAELWFVLVLVSLARSRTPGVRAAASLGLVVVVVVSALEIVRLAASGPAVEGQAAVFAQDLLQAALLTAAIFKDQTIGFSGKVRVTIRSGTVGAIFVAVFFAASELAQEVIGGTSGPYYGIAVAAGLVFFLAPLQRFGERLANAAVPGASPYTTAGVATADAYEAAVRFTLVDRKLSRREEAHLAVLAEKLALPAGEAMRLRHQVEDELRAQRRKSR